jgi:hypothetical protein
MEIRRSVMFTLNAHSFSTCLLLMVGYTLRSWGGILLLTVRIEFRHNILRGLNYRKGDMKKAHSIVMKIDIGKTRRTQQKLFIISYTILLFVIHCN